MKASFFRSAIELAEGFFKQEAGSFSFLWLLVICAVAWAVVARLLMALFSRGSGFIAAFLVGLISFGAGVLAYTAVDIYLVPSIEASWAEPTLLVVGCVIGVVLVALILGRPILKMGAGETLFIYTAATGAAACVYFLAMVTFGVIESGGGQVEQREQRIQEELKSIR